MEYSKIIGLIEDMSFIRFRKRSSRPVQSKEFISNKIDHLLKKHQCSHSMKVSIKKRYREALKMVKLWETNDTNVFGWLLINERFPWFVLRSNEYETVVQHKRNEINYLRNFLNENFPEPSDDEEPCLSFPSERINKLISEREKLLKELS